jgi:hypothetical protein
VKLTSSCNLLRPMTETWNGPAWGSAVIDAEVAHAGLELCSATRVPHNH